VAQKVHQNDATGLRWVSKKEINTAVGGHVNNLPVAIAANELPASVGFACRRILAGVVASAALALWSSGAMAAACAGAAGASTSSITPTLFNLQCLQAIQIPGNPLQTFGGSAFLRTSATTASYFLADRSNLGIDVINGSTLKFTRTLKPPAGTGTGKDPTGGFIGQLIWTPGPAVTGGTRAGTPDEAHSGPNGIVLYPSDSTAKWLWVADGGCNTAIAHATMATPSSAGTEGACGTPADPSTLPDPNYTKANCINGTSTQGCYPIQHQPNIKLFNLTTNAWVKSYPTGGGPGGPNNPCTGCYPLGNYAPTGDAKVLGNFGASRADAIAIGEVGGTAYMLVSTPGEPFIPTAAQPTSGKFGACDAAAPTAPPESPPPPFTSQPTASFPYVTLFSISTANPPVATYLATINVDDTSTGTLVGNGPFGCDFNGKRPPNPMGAVLWDARINRFIVALPNVLNNIPVNADGSGPGQSFVPDGPTGGIQSNDGCPYPQSTPPAANTVLPPLAYFWDCDGGLLVIDPTTVTHNTLNTIGYGGGIAPTPTAAGVVLKLGYCSPGTVAAGPDLALANTVPGAPYAGAFANVFLGCSPRFNGNIAGTGVAVSIAESYSTALNVESNPFGLPGPFPAIDPVSPFNQTVAAFNPNNGATPPTPGCSVQNPGCPTQGQLNDGALYGYPASGTFFLNGVTGAHLNVSNFAKDPHWYVVVGGLAFNSTNITNLATRTPVIGYIDALSNQVVEYAPTSSGSNTIAVDEANYVAFVPVSGVVTPQLPAGDFTGNGVRLCGNGVTNLYGTVSGRGCVIVFHQQYLSHAK
jgi:hypothetical protein